MPGRYIELAQRLGDMLLERRVGALNMDGISAAMTLQMGISPSVASMFTLIARTPGIIASWSEARLSCIDQGRVSAPANS